MKKRCAADDASNRQRGGSSIDSVSSLTSGQAVDSRSVPVWVPVVGFASLQAFAFSVFYLGSNWAFQWGGVVFERAELFAVLLFMVLALRTFAARPAAERASLTAQPAVWLCAVAAAAGSLMPLFAADMQAMGLIAEGALVGVACGILLTAWGRVLGSQPFERSVPQVFLAFGAAAVVCFALSLVPLDVARYLACALPFASAAALRGAARFGSPQGDALSDAGEAEGGEPRGDGSAVATDEALRASFSVMAGTFTFGLACGFMEIYGSEPGGETTPAVSVAMAFFLLFCVAALRSFKAAALVRVDEAAEAGAHRANGRFGAFASALLGRSRDEAAAAGEGPLDAAYRLAVLLMMAGFLLVPVLGEYNVSGESIVLSGYLGLSAVLASLFLVVGALASSDAALAFARGFAVLFMGELAGVALGNVVDAAASSFGAQTPFVTVALAGVAVLWAYLFLFTEHDFRALSIAVEEAVTFEDAVDAIVRECGLSKREAEILPLALRGRTNERIAAELFVSKSTVDTHLRKIYGKCGVHSRQELIDLGERVQKGEAWK